MSRGAVSGPQRSLDDGLAYQRFRAPQRDGGVLVQPPWPDLPALVAANRQAAESVRGEFAGLPYQQVRSAMGRAWLLDAIGVSAPADKPLIVSGHQPELFHPGVWFKNFALGRLAEQVGGIGVNLVIDNDLCRSASIRVPTGSVQSPRVQAVPYDSPAKPIPYEERGVLDAGLLKSFPQRVEATLGDLIHHPLVREAWPHVLRGAEETGNLGLAICRGRHALERRWGVANHEIPLSTLCNAPGFLHMAADLLCRLDAFHDAYNDSLAEYRQAHRIRTPAQPVPDLHQQGDWLEAPLWVWTTGDPSRRPVYARCSGGTLTLNDLQGQEWTLPGCPARPKVVAEGLAALLREQGVKLRPRALTTTLYARLLLADLFLHGIGGAKYDQITDRIAQRFYGFAPPPHATLSATLRLPIAHDSPPPHSQQQVARQLRELQFNPQRFLADNPAAEPARTEKLRWVQTPKSPGNAARRHRAIAAANAAMQPLVEDRRRQLLEHQRRLTGQARAASVLESREYAWCLFPEDWLRPQLLDAAEA